MRTKAKDRLRHTVRLARRHLLTSWFRVVKPQIVKINGIKLKVDPRWPATMRDAFYKGSYEHSEYHLVSTVLTPSDRVLEIGAAVGFIGMRCCQIVGSSNVVSIEANPDICAIARENYALNGLSPTLINAAITSTSQSEVEFFISDHFWASSLSDKDGTTHAIKVRGVSFSEAVALYRPTALVMDVEGAEFEILKDSDLDSINKICIEFHPQFIDDTKITQIFSKFISAGFRIGLSESRGKVVYFHK